MTTSPSAETRLGRLLERLLNAAESSLNAGDLETARATAEEVRAVDPDNQRAAELIHRISTRHQAPAGERALMSLLFADVVDSTALSQQVEPERLRDVFSRYRAVAKEAVERYGGYVMQYTGDGILAGFGYPEAHEDDARRAVLAALDLVTGMHAAREELGRLHGVEPHIRVGLHTGRVVVTDLTSDRAVRERESIVGVAPNLAARIQQAADPDTVVISDITQQLVDTDFYVSSLGMLELKGITRPVEVFAVDRPRYAGARLDAERYRRAGLVGRDDLTGRLLSAWEGLRAAPSTSGGTFLVVGEAGIGKTRLVAEVRDRVTASGGETFGAGSLPYYSNVALWPIAQMLERVIGAAAGDTDRLGALVEHLTTLSVDPERTVPFLAPLLGITETPGYALPELDPTAHLDETLNRLVDWLVALAAAAAPTLLIIEDLHWADPSTVALLGRLAARGAPRLVTVVTTRDATVVPWRDEAEVIDLARLDDEASATFVDKLVADQELSAELRAGIVERAEGIPLFIEELTRSCLAAESDEPLPLKLQELLVGRLKAPGLDLRVAQVAATVGPTFDAAAVTDVVGDEDRVSDQLARLAEEGIIEPGDPGSYRFRHALLRDAAYETQVLEARSQTHLGVAASLTERGGAPALIAQHLDLGGDDAGAVTQYLAAAQAEQGRGAHTEATRLLSRALVLLDRLPESAERDLGELTARMLRGLSVSSMQGYAAPDVQADHRRAEVLATRLGTRPEVLPSLIAIWAYWLVSGDLATAEGLITRLTDMVRLPEYAWFRPEVESCAGWVELYRGHLAAARDHLERCIAGYRERPEGEKVSPFWPLPNDPIAVSDIALACVAALRGDLDEAAEWEKRAISRAEEIGFPRGPFSLGFVKAYAAWIRRFLGDDDASQAFGAEVVGIGQEYGYAYWVMLGSSYVATAEPGGAPDRGFMEQTITTLRMMGQEAFVASNLAYLAHLEAEAGGGERAADLIEDALLAIHKNGEEIHLPEVLQLRAVYRIAAGGDPRDAADDLVEAIEVASEQGAAVSRLRAAVALAGLPDDARPSDWRSRLQDARAAIPHDLPAAGTDAADVLLAG